MEQTTQASQTPVLIDARQPRLGQAISGSLLLINFVLAPDRPFSLPLLAVVMGLASIVGPRFNVYAYFFKALKPRFGPPKELEEPWPPRFANLVGFVFLTAASIAAYPLDSELGWILGLIVSALALLAATTGLCVGCEMYVVARRIVTRGRMPSKVVVHKVVA
jgi:hypothetical protein